MFHSSLFPWCNTPPHHKMAVFNFIPLASCIYHNHFVIITLPYSCLQQDLQLSSTVNEERHTATLLHMQMQIDSRHMSERSPHRIPSVCSGWITDQYAAIWAKQQFSSSSAVIPCLKLLPNGFPHCCRQKRVEQRPLTPRQNFWFSLIVFIFTQLFSSFSGLGVKSLFQ